jgi:excisionase family DNA binding protein
MTPQIEISLPNEMQQEIDAYTKSEGMNVTEFIFWALGEKVGELRERQGVKNLIKTNSIRPDVKATGEENQQPSNPKRLLVAKEVAKYLRVSESEVYKLMRTGEIHVVRIGAAVRVQEEDFEKYIQDSRT